MYNAYLVGVVFFYECGTTDSRQLHLCSARVIVTVEAVA